MKWKKEILEEAVKGSLNKNDVLKKLGKNKNSYKTLNRYLKKFEIPSDHIKARVKSFETNDLRKYSKGDKHPTEELYFWQYRFDRKNSKGFEQWYTKESFEKANKNWRKNNYNYTRRDILAYLTRNALTRQKSKYIEKENLINVDYIKKIWQSQNGKCFWLNIPMKLNISGKETDLYKVSIDRLDCSKGYIKGNVVLASNFANRGRGNSNLQNWKYFLKSLNIKNE